jgi:hypothetical protein
LLVLNNIPKVSRCCNVRRTVLSLFIFNWYTYSIVVELN